MTTDDLIRAALGRPRTIAVVGFSANPARPSHGVAKLLRSVGHRVIPVNPGLAGQSLLGETARASLAETPEADVVDVFRRSEEVAGVVEAALAHLPRLEVIWTQLGVRDDAAAERARARGVLVIQDRCPAIEIPRLGIPRVA
jgi:hypothetical protein